jgi:hypothetical protein
MAFAGIIGVASESSKESIIVYNSHQKYDEWEFVAIFGAQMQDQTRASNRTSRSIQTSSPIQISRSIRTSRIRTRSAAEETARSRIKEIHLEELRKRPPSDRWAASVRHKTRLGSAHSAELHLRLQARFHDVFDDFNFTPGLALRALF